MKYFAILLYPAAGIILLWMWAKVRKKKLDQIVDEASDEHHTLLKIAENHPYGGSQAEYRQWMKDYSDKH